MEKLTTTEDLCVILGLTLNESEKAEMKIESILIYLQEKNIIKDYNADKLDWEFSDWESY